MRITLYVWSFIGITAFSVSAQEGSRYDLTCSGMLTSVTTDAAGKKDVSPAIPYSTQLHVDLSHNNFCQDTCGTPERIRAILPSDIIFRANASPQLSRLWVADDGQFSITWAENQLQAGGQVLKSAQGGCIKSFQAPVSAPIHAIAKTTTPIAKKSTEISPSPGSDAPPSERLSFAEISALIDIKNQRPISATLHTSLHSLGLIRLQDNLWILTKKGDLLISGDVR